MTEKVNFDAMPERHILVDINLFSFDYVLLKLTWKFSLLAIIAKYDL